MVKKKFICNNCHSEYPKWSGQCLGCKQYNSIEETQLNSKSAHSLNLDDSQVYSLADIEINDQTRIMTQLQELDLVLGGGLVEGSLTLLAGSPGVGKSTLLLQIANQISKSQKSLYVSGEENLSQIKLRVKRLKLNLDCLFLNETNLENILYHVHKNKIKFLIIDSIQTTNSQEQASAFGTVGQIKTVTMLLMDFANKNNITIIIVGHITKDGDIAGPKMLEHMVDTVIYLELEKDSNIRILQSAKNRFGSIEQIGLLHLLEDGFHDVMQTTLNYMQPQDINVSGVAISAIIEGNKEIFVEVETLINPTKFTNPKRFCQGIDIARLNVMVALLNKRVGIDLNYCDIYVKVLGGIKLNKTDIDLALAMALYSIKKELVVPLDTVLIAEVTLTGVLKNSMDTEKLITKAQRLGFKRVIISAEYKTKKHQIKVIKCTNINQVIENLWEPAC